MANIPWLNLINFQPIWYLIFIYFLWRGPAQDVPFDFILWYTAKKITTLQEYDQFVM